MATKIIIICESDSDHSVRVRASVRGKEYFDRLVHPGQEAVLDKHAGIQVVVADVTS